MQQLTKEDIQAIAQELNTLQQRKRKAQQNAQSTTNTQAHARNMGAICEKPTKGETARGEAKPTSTINSKNIASIGLLTFWGVVFVIFLVKLAPYI